MSEEIPKSPDETGLRTQREAGLANLPNCGLRPLSEIIKRSLVHIQTSKSQWVLRRIGEHNLYGPDYQMLCTWAEELVISEEEVLQILLNSKKLSCDDSFETSLSKGHFRSLFVDGRLLPVSFFPSSAGLEIERISLFYTKIRRLEIDDLFSLQFLDTSGDNPIMIDLSGVPNLKRLGCGYGEVLNLSLAPHLEALYYSGPLTGLFPGALPALKDFVCVVGDLAHLDLSPFPGLEILQCQGNPLTELNLSPVTKLNELYCWSNNIHDLDLTPVRNLKVLWCGDNQIKNIDLSKVPDLIELKYFCNQPTILQLSCTPNLNILTCADLKIDTLDLTPVPNLVELNCSKNSLTDLSLRVVPNLEELDCSENPLHVVDIRPLRSLKTLKHDSTTRIIQRPDQNFK
jgi:Leucine-rich repeat (LRR) protein